MSTCDGSSISSQLILMQIAQSRNTRAALQLLKSEYVNQPVLKVDDVVEGRYVRKIMDDLNLYWQPFYHEDMLYKPLRIANNTTLLFCIDALINSPEWSLSRFVVKIRIALCSSLESTTTSNLGMPVLVSIKNEKNPIIDENKLLDWGDCIIFVFDFHSILSFQACKSLMKRLRRNGLCLAKIPCILVGIKDDNSIMDINPQMIDKFINDYPNLVYMETCTIHDIKNVSKIFHKACVSALSFKGVLLDTEKLQPQCDPQSSNSTTTCSADIYASQNSVIATAGSALSSLESCNSPVKYLLPLSAPNYQTRSSHISHVNRGVECREQTNNNTQSRNNNAEKLVVDLALPKTKFGTVLKVVKQGYLMKKSSSSLKQDWKQKYVVIDQEGQLWYYRNVDDFLRGQRGKSLSLKFVTVKQSVGKNASCSTIIRRNRQLTIPDCNISERSSTVPFLRQSISADPYILKTPLFSRLDRKFGKKQTSASTTKLSQYDIRTDVKELADNDNGYITPKSKSRQTQLDECSFTIVPMNGRALMFEAKSHKEREEWIESIQEQITLLLLSNRSKVNEKRNSLTNSNPTIGNVKLLLKPLAGNHICADCSAPDPEWASINLGILVCIDCSGSHRDLGTHISRIRSLDLDIWNEELQTIMKSFGNQFANRIWEAELWEDPKPTPNSHR
ncbi:hypothetical protein GJ496_010523 [Pomphorhynchus laevis]|nr:hypothetical protein GJ496_010523 [Pomphorhynchus laevis]